MSDEQIIYAVSPRPHETHVWFGNPDAVTVQHDGATVTLAIAEAMGAREQGLLVRLRRETWARIVADAAPDAQDRSGRTEGGA